MSRDPFKPTDTPSELPRGPHGLDREVVLASQRGRLLAAFVEVAAEKGYHAVTIQDIVSRAGTAKRTFYEHFRDKQDCFIQAFDLGSSSIVATIVQAAEPVHHPIERIDVGVRAYLDDLARYPQFTRFFLTEGMAAGPDLAEHWIAWVDALADTLVVWRRESRKQYPEVPEISKMHALAVISAINEVVRIAVHRDGVEAIPGLRDELAELAIALLTADPRA